MSFGITAAVEAIVHRDYGARVNLSEQFLYNQAKQFWFPSVYGDGLSTANMFFNMTLRVFRYPYESDWDYNKSWDRIDAVFLYLNSCSGYVGEQCSDANHQAKHFCTKIGSFNFCGFLDPADTISPSSGYFAGLPASYIDPGLLGAVWARACLLLGKPVIYSFTVPALSLGLTPKTGPTAGYVPYIPFEPTKGGHCMLLVGWIPNSQLPSGAPAGAGGGYFIAKNSWGTHVGDGGYLYLPDAWVQHWGTGMYTISGVAKL